MKDVTRILMLSLCAALSLSSCNKNHHAPDDLDQKIPIGFSAVSQTNMLKSGATTPLSSHHQDFGVWGIARMDGQADYVLWKSDEMSAVRRSGQTNDYIPDEEAYWLSGYTYNFLAVAPFEAVQNPTITQGSTSGDQKIKFSYDLSSKYELKDENDAPAPDYEFDLMAAVADTTVASASTHTSAQPLTFYHLFSRINIRVSFVDAEGDAADGLVTKMSLRNVDTDAEYTIAFAADKSLSVACSAGEASTEELSFGSGSASVHIVPQNISNFELYLDFTQDAISTTDFKVDIQTANTDKNYAYNEQYNWNITIGPKAAISFSVSVVPWSHNSENDFNYDII